MIPLYSVTELMIFDISVWCPLLRMHGVKLDDITISYRDIISQDNCTEEIF